MTPTKITPALSDITIADILDAATLVTGIRSSQIVARNNTPRMVALRRAICEVAHDAGHSYPSIGRGLLRHHSTIVVLCKQPADPAMKGKLRDFAELVVSKRVRDALRQVSP